MNLGPGFIGHDTLPPAPNHGFSVALPDVGRTSEVLPTSEERYIWVNASYDVLDDGSLTAAIQSEDRTQNQMHRGARPTSYHRMHATLVGVPAITVKTERDKAGKRVIEETVTAVRSGIIYQVGLVTSADEFDADAVQFRKVLAGFHWTKLPKGECSND